MKGQVLANFVAKFSPRKEMEIVCHVDYCPWVFMDSVSSAIGVGAKIFITTPEGIRLEYSFKLGFRASNNKAEYETLLARLRAVLDMGTRDVKIYLDS